MPDLDGDFVVSALLKANYLPTQKLDWTEVPPVFSTRSLDEAVAVDLASSRTRQAKYGYSSIKYSVTRFNNVRRQLEIPHPAPYCQLARSIRSGWASIEWIKDNASSRIRPRPYPDGRLFTMDYGSSTSRVVDELRQAFGKRYLVRADVDNFYPSIYTHAVPWAAVGRAEAKKRRDRSEWFNDLDYRLRQVNKAETHGVAIGPGTSSIIAELILGRIDEVLRNDFSHVRFIDDFYAFCIDEEEALRFIERLCRELQDFNLELNPRKTSVLPLPVTSSADWVHQLSLWAPKREVLTVHDVAGYLDLALGMASRTPDGSVLKYAVKTIRDRSMSDAALVALSTYVTNLAYHHPVLTPLLERIFDRLAGADLPLPDADCIRQLVGRHAQTRCSDGLCWSLHYAARLGIALDAELARTIVSNGDCLALTLLHPLGDDTARSLVLDFANSLVKGVLTEVDAYELDEYWLLLFELFAERQLANPYRTEDTFDVLLSHGVRFVKARER